MIRILSIVLITCAVAHAEPITNEAVTKIIEEVDLAALMEEHHTPGVSIAVFDDYEIIYAEGFGVRDSKTGELVDENTRFQAASISKPVAAIAVLTLVQEGIVDLDTPVNKYLTSWQVPFHQWAGVHPATLRLIMGHISGFTVHGFPGYSQGRDVPTVVSILNGTEPANTAAIFVDAQPGAVYRYSGGGYTVMQLAIQDVTGTPFSDFVQTSVLDPAGMTSSAMVQPPPKAITENIASAHNARGLPARGNWNVYPELAAAGLWTTPKDLAKFAIEMQRAYRGDEDAILTPKMAREALENVLGSGHGLGFIVQEKVFQHGGSNRGFKCTLVAFKQGGRGYAIMTNGDKGMEVSASVAGEFRRMFEEE